MGINSSVDKGSSNIFVDFQKDIKSGSNEIDSGLKSGFVDATQDVIDKITRQIKEMQEMLTLEPEEITPLEPEEVNVLKAEELTVNDYLDPSEMSQEDWDHYQQRLEEVIASSKTKKEAVANIAKFMAYEFPKLHYFWGGGHGLQEDDFYGIHSTWGTPGKIDYDDSDSWKLGEEFPISFDCSGFVTWVLINAGINIGDYYSEYNPEGDACLNTTSINPMGEHYKMNDENTSADDILNNIEPGDIAWQSSHTGIVTDVDKENKTITVVHISGSGQGTNVTTFEIPSGKILSDDLGEMPEFDYPAEEGDLSRDGTSPYQENTAYRAEGANTNPEFTLFTEFIHLEEKDE